LAISPIFIDASSINIRELRWFNLRNGEEIVQHDYNDMAVSLVSQPAGRGQGWILILVFSILL
jgi:hypothetical protein